eukprot:SAG11_NODE_3113_length_2693_cov_1.331136_3_plen_184_part_00
MQWEEEHGVLRHKAVRDEITGDVRTCAYEHEHCLCDGHVRYGDGDVWTDWRDVEEGIACNNDVFGDVSPHKVKICQCRPEIRDCAAEDGVCTCPGGRVRYGAGDGSSKERWSEWMDMESGEDIILCRWEGASHAISCGVDHIYQRDNMPARPSPYPHACLTLSPPQQLDLRRPSARRNEALRV